MNTSVKKNDLSKQFEFYSIVSDIINNKTVQKMKLYRQHYNTSTFEHCFNVAYISYRICKKLKLDYVSVSRAAMVHDLFLYDWRNSRKELNLDGYHAFVHPKIALDNATKLFDLNKKEQDIILKHMWPVTLRFPSYSETFIVTVVDKYSAILECFKFYKETFKNKKIFKYT